MSLDFFQARCVRRPSGAAEPPLLLLLAGGLGTRMRTHLGTARQPKLLLPLAPDRTMLQHALRGIDAAGIRRVVLLTSAAPDAAAEAIEAHALRNQGDLRMGVVRETRPLGTAGAVYAALRTLAEDSHAIVLPADTLFPFEQLTAFAATRTRANAAPLTWAVTTRPGPGAQNAGRLRVDHQQVVHAAEHHDRPISPAAPGTPATSAGAMALETRTYQRLFAQLVDRDAPKPVDLYRDVAPWLLRNGHTVGAWDIGCAAPDLGTPERLRRFAPRATATDADDRP